MVDRRLGRGAGRLLGHVADDELPPPGVLQGVVEHAVVLPHGVAAQPLRLLSVEVILDLGCGELV